MCMFNTLHHVAIICSNYSQSKKFYTEILGGKIINETYRAERQSYKLDIQIANCQIELFSFPTPPSRVTNPEACGLRHLAFAVSDIDATVLELKNKDAETEPIRIDPITDKRYTFFRDPDGLPIEIYEE